MMLTPTQVTDRLTGWLLLTVVFGLLCLLQYHNAGLIIAILGVASINDTTWRLFCIASPWLAYRLC